MKTYRTEQELVVPKSIGDLNFFNEEFIKRDSNGPSFYFGRNELLKDPPKIFGLNIYHIHIYDKNNPNFTEENQNEWKTRHEAIERGERLDKTSDTCLIYFRHPLDKDSVLMVAIVAPSHSRNGNVSKLRDDEYMNNLIESYYKFADTALEDLAKHYIEL